MILKQMDKFINKRTSDQAHIPHALLLLDNDTHN